MKYEGRLDLGNTQPGYGPHYHGRGPIQLTGRANYRAAGRDLGLPLEQNPEKAADPDVAFRIAGWYWTTRNLNRFADEGDAGLREVTRLINGGYNGLDDRERRYFNCKRVLPETFTLGKGVEEEDLSFERVVFGHATHADGELAHLAAAILHRHDVKCTVADAGNMKAAIAACQSEGVGWGEFVVIGKAAKDLFPDKLKPYIGETVKRSDYRDAMGDDLRESADKLARVLEGIAERKDVPGDLRREFEEALDLVEAERPAGQGHGPPPKDDGRADDGMNGGGGERQGSRPQGATMASNGNGTKREDDGAEGSVKVRPDDLTDADLEEIGREALELFATIRRLTGQSRF
jgi:Chitinase class I